MSMKEIVEQVDKNNDGKVSFDEFKIMMKNSAVRHGRRASAMTGAGT